MRIVQPSVFEGSPGLACAVAARPLAACSTEVCFPRSHSSAVLKACSDSHSARLASESGCQFGPLSAIAVTVSGGARSIQPLTPDIAGGDATVIGGPHWTYDASATSRQPEPMTAHDLPHGRFLRGCRSSREVRETDRAAQWV